MLYRRSDRAVSGVFHHSTRKFVCRIDRRKESSSGPEGGGLSCAVAFDWRRRLNSSAESEFVAAAGGKICESTVDFDEARFENVALSSLVRHSRTGG